MALKDGLVSRPKRIQSEEFRRSVVDQLLSSGKSAAQVAREFGISSENVRQWKLRYGPAVSPIDAAAAKSPEELARENREVRRELSRVIMQRDILKKTIAIVSEQSNRDIV
jgi:transposase